ncbi:hypothetical protein GCM10022206_50400 [Streptomyces chiangmaiensis]
MPSQANPPRRSVSPKADREGFARFEIAIWNPERAWFSDKELTAIGDVLGHPVQQVRAHI